MLQPKVAVIVGSIRAVSINAKLARALQQVAASNCKMENLAINNLPLYNQDLDETPPEPVLLLKEQVMSADALLFVTPEHNRSITAALKNALDWASRPYGQNLWAGKPAAIAGASVSAIGTAVAQQDLRRILAYLDVPTLGQPEVFVQLTPGLIDENGSIHDESTRIFLTSFVDRFRKWIETIKPTFR